ncbi:MAG: hypothetical protein ACRD4H_07950 [Candidatus Acidiferrales bacterium]
MLRPAQIIDSISHAEVPQPRKSPSRKLELKTQPADGEVAYDALLTDSEHVAGPCGKRASKNGVIADAVE